jgi:hypothetical protein
MKRLLAAIIVAGAVLPAAYGSPVGELNIAGAWRIFATAIDFDPFGPPSGMFLVTAGSTGAYAPLIATTGTILDLDATVQPVGVPFLLPAWITFAAAPNLVFDLTFIEPGTFGSAACFAPPATGQQCTPPFPPPAGSPFNLTNTTADSSTASFRVQGIAHDLSDGTSLPYLGEFTSQFPTQNFQELLAELAAAGFVEKSYSATFVIIPEAQTGYLLLTGAGAIALGMIRRRRNK